MWRLLVRVFCELLYFPLQNHFSCMMQESARLWPSFSRSCTTDLFYYFIIIYEWSSLLSTEYFLTCVLVNFNVFCFYILLYYLMLSKLFLYRCYSCLDAHFYDDETVTVVLKESVQQEGKERVLAQLPLSSVYTDEDQDRKFIWDSMERYWKTLSKSENVELKSKLSKYCDCVQLLILCACVKILKTETLFVPGE